MTQDDYRYPKDEFDELGRDRAPQAVHRAPRPWWRVWAPLIAVAILAPVLALTLVRLATQDSDSNASTTSSATSETTATSQGQTDPTDDGAASEGESATEEPGEGEEPATGDPATEEPAEPTEEPVTEVPLDQTVAVSVLNGASVQGLAGRTAERLNTAGWGNTTAGNYQSGQPDVSTVYYQNADLADEAAAIAAELGIGPVSELADIASITVVLRSDFAE